MSAAMIDTDESQTETGFPPVPPEAHQRAGLEQILTPEQRAELYAALAGKPIALSFGAGVDSTALLIALRAAGLRPSVITFADTGGEKAATLRHVKLINRVLASWGWPLVSIVRKVPMEGTGYADLFGNCWKNETLPSLAFGMKSCSIKWKTVPQDQFILGVKRGPNVCPPHPVWLEAKAAGQKITKLIGYDCGKADMRRSRNLPPSDANFEFFYPLQLVRWARRECVRAIVAVLGADFVPVKSACFFCPASKHWELYWLAAEEPELLERALQLEYNALTGKHSRFDEVEFGASWETLVREADSFPSTTTSVGLGRSFSWNQWARVNGVVDADFKVIREQRMHFMSMSEIQRGPDNAYDVRSVDQAAAREQLDLVF